MKTLLHSFAFLFPRLGGSCFAFILAFIATLAPLQTARAATGDLVVVCYNSDGNDEFALIALANLPQGARYFITDSGWSTSANNLMQEGLTPTNVQQIQLDVIKPGGIPFGTVLKFDQSGATVVLTDPTLATLTMVNRFAASSLPLLTKLSFNANLGDQLLIYQTAGDTVGGAITMVSAFNGSNLTAAANPPDSAITLTDGWQVGTLPRPSQGAGNPESNLPAGLIAYNGSNASTATALGLASFPVGGLTNQDNYKYVGSYALADKTAFLTSINNPANWVADDTTPFPLATVGPSSAPAINVQGNGNNIADGSATPLASDFTLFGTTPVTGGTIARTFTIRNIGTANLTVPAGGITFTGTNAGDFSVSGITLPAVIAPSGNTTFTVTFDPSSAGIRTATVNIASDDTTKNPYDFAIQGNGFVSVAPTGTAPTLAWSPTVQNANFGTTRAVGSTNSGDVIAATRITSGVTASDIRITRHVGGTGVVAWTRDISNGTFDDINDMIVDPATGDAYVCARATAGANGIDWFVVKVDGTLGTVAWTYTHSGTLGTGIDECFDLARTSDGNVVAVGTTTSVGNNVFARAAKINASTGVEMWAYVNGSVGGQFNGVATDTLGNTFATGVINAANTNGLTVKLSSAGAQSWAVTFDGVAGLSDSFSNVVVDPAGDCVVAGTTRISSTDSDVIVLKYGAAAGNEVWRRTIAGGGAGLDALHNLVVDASGNLYASGAIRSFTTTDRDAFVSKITGAGASAWIATKFGSAADSNDRFQNVRVVGSAVYAVGDIENATRDILVSRFDATTGAEVWTATYNGTGNGLDDVASEKHVMAVLGTDVLLRADAAGHRRCRPGLRELQLRGRWHARADLRAQSDQQPAAGRSRDQ